MDEEFEGLSLGEVQGTQCDYDAASPFGRPHNASNFGVQTSRALLARKCLFAGPATREGH